MSTKKWGIGGSRQRLERHADRSLLSLIERFDLDDVALLVCLERPQEVVAGPDVAAVGPDKDIAEPDRPGPVAAH